MKIVVILLVFVCWASSQKIYEINIDYNNGNNKIRTQNFTEKLRINISKLESRVYEMQCEGCCKGNGTENKLDFSYCKVKREYGKHFRNSSQFISAETNLNASIYGEWLCEFKLKKPNNQTTYINVNLTFDKMEQCIDSYISNGYDEIDPWWKIIGIVSISICIGEAIYIAVVCVKTDRDRTERVKLAEYLSEIWTLPPPPSLPPKMKSHDLSARSSINGTEAGPSPSISTEQFLDNTTDMPEYEEMKPLQQLIKRRVDNIYETLRKKRFTKYQDVLSRIYENDIVLLQNGRSRPPFDKSYEPTMGFDDVFLPFTNIKTSS